MASMVIVRYSLLDLPRLTSIAYGCSPTHQAVSMLCYGRFYATCLRVQPDHEAAELAQVVIAERGHVRAPHLADT